MRKALVALLLLASLVAPVAADQWENTATKVANSVLYLENSEGSCTAFVINAKQKFVMSAAHCYDDKTIWVDRVTARVVSLDTKKDLMVLEVPNLDPSKTELGLAAKNPVVGQEVASDGFGYGLERPQFRSASVSDPEMMVPEIGGPFVAVNVSFSPGQSGGPVVDSDGNVVAIVQRGDGGTLGFGVGAETIRERMGRFFAKK